MFLFDLPYGSYGFWQTPITTEWITEGSIGFGDMQSDGSTLYWTEIRPKEKGRAILMKKEELGPVTQISDAGSVRTRVHEYGGGAFSASLGVVYFSNDLDKSYYRIDAGGNYTGFVMTQIFALRMEPLAGRGNRSILSAKSIQKTGKH